MAKKKKGATKKKKKTKAQIQADRKERLKNLCKGKAFRPKEDQIEVFVATTNLPNGYEDYLRPYLKKDRYWKYFKTPFNRVHKMYHCFRRAAQIMLGLGVDPEAYLSAHFYWHNKWFAKAPMPIQMSSIDGKVPSSKRVLDYLELMEIKAAPRSIVRTSTKFKASRDQINEANEKHLQELISSWQMT